MKQITLKNLYETLKNNYKKFDDFKEYDNFFYFFQEKIKVKYDCNCLIVSM